MTLQGSELNGALSSERWRDLADWMAEQLLGVTPLGSLRIDNTVLELRAQVAAQTDSICRRFRLEAEAGTVQFCPLDEDARRLLYRWIPRSALLLLALRQDRSPDRCGRRQPLRSVRQERISGSAREIRLATTAGVNR